MAGFVQLRRFDFAAAGAAVLKVAHVAVPFRAIARIAVLFKGTFDLQPADAALLPVAACIGFPTALCAVALRADLVRVNVAADEARCLLYTSRCV